MSFVLLPAAVGRTVELWKGIIKVHVAVFRILMYTPGNGRRQSFGRASTGGIPVASSMRCARKPDHKTEAPGFFLSQVASKTKSGSRPQELYLFVALHLCIVEILVMPSPGW